MHLIESRFNINELSISVKKVEKEQNKSKA